MSQLACNCPHCGQELNVESDHAGQVVACPSCSGEFTVPEAPTPTPPQAPALAPAPRLNVPNAPATRPIQPQGQTPYHQQQAPNPYQSPAANPGGPQGYGAYGGAPSPHSIQLFAQTKPWVTLFAVLGSIWPAMMLLLGLLSAFAGVSAGAVGEGMGAGLMLASIGAIYFLPAWRLWQFSSAIGKLRFNPSLQALDNAIDKQRCFWKTVGLITLIAFALAVTLVVMGGMLAGGATADEADLFLN